jgi:hypothetical protein
MIATTYFTSSEVQLIKAIQRDYVFKAQMASLPSNTPLRKPSLCRIFSKSRV